MSTGTFRGNMALAATLAALVIWPAAATATASADWGWAVVRRPAESSYEIRGKDRGSSAHGTVTYTRNGRGRSVVTFDGLAYPSMGGNVQVSALSSGPSICVVEGWLGSPSETVVHARCFSRAGKLKDVPYVVSYARVHVTTGTFAYAWVNDPGETGPYEPDPDYVHVPGVEQAWASRSGVGTYALVFDGLGYDGGDVQLSAYGTQAVVCRVDNWYALGPDLTIAVRCRDQSGSLIDQRYSAAFMRKEGLKADAGASWAYLWANRPTRASYVPNDQYRKADPAGKPTVRRISRGVYEVVLPSMPRGGAAQVTAYGTGRARCNISSIRRTGLPQRIGVRCWKADGSAPADARFTLSFLK